MATETGQHQMYDKLEHELRLSNLINPESLANLVTRFGDFLRIGFVALDLDGSVLTEHGERVRLCRFAADGDPCPACRGELPEFTGGDEKFLSLCCPTEVEYLRVRVDNQFEPIGYVIIGPFASGPPTAAVDSDALKGARAALPELASERAREVAQLLCTVLEEVVFANYQSYLFSKMHLQLSKDNLGEMTGGPVDEEPSYEQTLLDSGDYRSLF